MQRMMAERSRMMPPAPATTDIKITEVNRVRVRSPPEQFTSLVTAGFSVVLPSEGGVTSGAVESGN